MILKNKSFLFSIINYDPIHINVFVAICEKSDLKNGNFVSRLQSLIEENIK